MSPQSHRPWNSGPRRKSYPPRRPALPPRAGQAQPPAPTSQISFPDDIEDSHTKPDQERLKGEVVSWVPSPAYGYHGYIRCENQSKIPGLVLVNSTLLRNDGDQVAKGDMVEFNPVPVTRGYLAKDVVVIREEMDAYEGVDPEDATTYVLGVLRYVNPQRYFGILELPDGRTAFLHFSNLRNPDAPLLTGSVLRCRLEQNTSKMPARLEAVDAALSDIRPAQSARHQAPTAHSRRANELLAEASLAREQGQLPKAAAIYDKILRECPVPQAVLNYAAMKRSSNEDKEAARIFQQGIEQFPNIPILREHAGLLAASVADFTTATTLLKKALDLSRQPGQQGEKGILLSLARTYNRMAESQGRTALSAGGLSLLSEAIGYYTQAAKRFGARGLPFERDKRNFDLAKFRTQHHRGNLAVAFLRSAGFEIVRAQVLDDRTTGGDLLIKSTTPELAESYGLSSQILVRCVFQSEVTMLDLSSFDDRIKSWAQEHGCEEGAALMIMGSLSQDIQKLLNARISDRRENTPTIIPIAQEDIERSADALKTLRAALDKWLFRRDLFATNNPVAGDHFFGRANALAEVGDAIAASRSVGIFGLRKVGKTSVLQELRRRASASGDIVLYRDFLSFPAGTGVDHLYWDFANQLRQASNHLNPAFKWRLGGVFESDMDIPDSFPTWKAFNSDLRNVLSVINSTPISPRPKVVLMLDEVERLLPARLGQSGFGGFFDFLSYFRGISQETKDFTMIVTAANPSIQEAAQFDGQDNPVFSYFRETYLKLLEEPELTKMVTTLGRGMGIKFEPQACSHVFALTGGHPFITRMFCSNLSDTYKDRPLTVTPKMVEGVAEDYVDLPGNDKFKEIFERLDRDYPNERDLCIKLAQTPEGISLKTLDKESVRHLIGYQLVKLNGSAVVLSMDLMKRWLKRNYGTRQQPQRNP